MAGGHDGAFLVGIEFHECHQNVGEELPRQISGFTMVCMEIEFDSVKDAENKRRHEGLSLALAAELDWDAALIRLDDRFDYDEIRLDAIVPMGDRLYNVTFTERGEVLRIISLRRAKNMERRRYVEHYF